MRTTPTKREETISRIMDCLHNFNKACQEDGLENLPLTRRRRKEEYASAIMDIVLENYE